MNLALRLRQSDSPCYTVGMEKNPGHRADIGRVAVVMRAGTRFILRLIRGSRRQVPEEIRSSQRGITPTLASDGANPNFPSFVSQPKTPRTTLQDLSSFREGFSYSALTRTARFAKTMADEAIVATLSQQLRWSISTFDDKAPSLPGRTRPFDHAAVTTRAFNRAKPARPYIWRLIVFSRFT